MSDPTNIDIFNKVVAQTFILLHENFPKPIDLDPLRIGLDIVLSEGYEADSPAQRHLVGTPEATIGFLIDEGYVRYNRNLGTLDSNKFMQCVLTAKGFSLLESFPDSIDPGKDRRSFIQKLKSAASGGIKSAVPEIIGGIVKQMIGAG